MWHGTGCPEDKNDIWPEKRQKGGCLNLDTYILKSHEPVRGCAAWWCCWLYITLCITPCNHFLCYSFCSSADVVSLVLRAINMTCERLLALLVVL